MHLPAKYRPTKFLTFQETIALQRLQIELLVRGVERDVGLHTLPDAPHQFLELWSCPPCGEHNYFTTYRLHDARGIFGKAIYAKSIAGVGTLAPCQKPGRVSCPTTVSLRPLVRLGSLVSYTTNLKDPKRRASSLRM